MEKVIQIEGIPVLFKRRKGAKSMRLYISKSKRQACLTMPWFALNIMGERFVKAHIVWLKEQLKLYGTAHTFQDGQNICLLGQPLRIQWVGGTKTGEKDGTLFIGGEACHLHRRVSDYIKRQTLAYIEHKAAEYAGRPLGHIRLRDTYSRWGSCSAQGHLSFCWRLGLAPLFVLDYVIAHEVTHLSEMNHSYRFWQKLKAINPDAARAKRWLATNGHTLH